MSAPTSPSATPGANAPGSPAPRPRRPRRPRDEGEVFGSFTPWKNPVAVYAYAVSLAGLTPALGVLLGPVAVLLGIFGVMRYRRRPEVLGLNFAVAGIVLGTLDTLFNAAGLLCLARGLGW